MKRLWLLLFFVLSCAPQPHVATAWRVTTYNIHHARGMDGKVDLERIAAVLERTAADVIALQEMDERVARSGGVDQARRLGQLLGMRHAFGSFMDYQGGRYGLALLSRYPIKRTSVIRLPDGNEPRVALAATIERPGSTVTVVSLHFDWVASDSFRYVQAQHLATVLDTLSTPYILAGDFNDLPGSRTLALFRARALEAAKPPQDRFTFSSTQPVREIDFIFAAPKEAWRSEGARVLDEPVASDHRPVTAVLVHNGR